MICGTSRCSLETHIQSIRSLLELQNFCLVFACAFGKRDAVVRVTIVTRVAVIISFRGICYCQICQENDVFVLIQVV